MEHGLRGLIRSTRVNDSHAAVVRGKCKGISARRKGNSMHPTSRVVQEFAADGVERKSLTPSRGLWSLVNALDVTREHSGVRIRRSGSQKNRVGVPCEGSNSTTDRLLQMFGNPPVVFLFEVANGDHSSSGADGEFLLGWGPSNVCGSAVDSEKNEGRLPTVGCLLPNVGIAV